MSRGFSAFSKKKNRKRTKTVRHNQYIWQSAANPHQNHRYTALHLPCGQGAAQQCEATRILMKVHSYKIFTLIKKDKKTTFYYFSTH